MLLNTLLITGLASLAAAIPHVHARFGHEVGERSAHVLGRGVHYTPRDNRGQNIQEITITQIQGGSSLSSSQRNSDVELIQLVQERIIIIDQTQKNRDNIRKNHFRNLYSNVNTIVVVVTPVSDQRNGNNKNTRYMTRRIQTNVQSSQQVIVVIQESNAIIINGNNNGRGNGQGNRGPTPAGVASSQSTGISQVNPNVVSIDPNSVSTISNNNNCMLLPAGLSLPNFGGLQVIQDPALILESNQQMSVSFRNQQQQSASIININAGAAGVTIITA